MIKKYINWLNESKISKPIWQVEKVQGLESIATDETDDKLVKSFLEKIDATNPVSTNLVNIALSFITPVKISEIEGPLHPNRCFLSSVQYDKDRDDTESIIGIIKRKGSNRAWVHAFNKRDNMYFDKSLTPAEYNDYEHYPLSSFLGKDEYDVAFNAWLHANSLQKAATDYLKK
jgi:hypothetical protein